MEVRSRSTRGEVRIRSERPVLERAERPVLPVATSTNPTPTKPPAVPADKPEGPVTDG